MSLAFLLMWIVALGLVVWCVSTTIAQAKVFEPFRDWISPYMEDEADWFKVYAYRKGWPWGRKVRATIWELISCQRCLAHYVAAVAVWLFPFELLQTRFAFVAWLANWFLVVAVNDVIARKLQKRCTISYRRGRNPE